jgi:hypothetical protein
MKFVFVQDDEKVTETQHYKHIRCREKDQIQRGQSGPACKSP